MKKRLVILLAGSLLSVSPLVVADDSQKLNIDEPYIQLGLGGALGRDDNYAAIKLSGGVGLNKRFGVEVGLASITDIFDADVDFLYLCLVAKHPIAEKTTLAGKLGAVKWDAEIHPLFSSTIIEDDGVNAMVGVELKYDLFKKVAITLSLDYYGSANAGNSGGDETIIPGTLGIRLTF